MKRSEDDVADDEGMAAARDAGGEPGDQEEADGASTTGTAPNETYVGRVAGDDEGYAGETGAEARAGS
jgi:hypothetical protein